jgi:hypothetical protein
MATLEIHALGSAQAVLARDRLKFGIALIIGFHLVRTIGIVGIRVKYHGKMRDRPLIQVLVHQDDSQLYFGHSDLRPEWRDAKQEAYCGEKYFSHVQHLETHKRFWRGRKGVSC